MVVRIVPGRLARPWWGHFRGVPGHLCTVKSKSLIRQSAPGADRVWSPIDVGVIHNVERDFIATWWSRSLSCSDGVES